MKHAYIIKHMSPIGIAWINVEMEYMAEYELQEKHLILKSICFLVLGQMSCHWGRYSY